MRSLEDRVELAWLMAFYAGVLTDRQRRVLSLYCEEDLSLSEIAEMTGVSRQNVHETVTRTADKLYGLETRLHLAERFRLTERQLVACRAALEAGETDRARKLLDDLIRIHQEDQNGL